MAISLGNVAGTRTNDLTSQLDNTPITRPDVEADSLVTVKAGDSLSSIARASGRSLDELKQDNPELFSAKRKNGNAVFPGDQVVVRPRAKSAAADPAKQHAAERGRDRGDFAAPPSQGAAPSAETKAAATRKLDETYAAGAAALRSQARAVRNAPEGQRAEANRKLQADLVSFNNQVHAEASAALGADGAEYVKSKALPALKTEVEALAANGQANAAQKTAPEINLVTDAVRQGGENIAGLASSVQSGIDGAIKKFEGSAVGNNVVGRFAGGLASGVAGLVTGTVGLVGGAMQLADSQVREGAGNAISAAIADPGKVASSVGQHIADAWKEDGAHFAGKAVSMVAVPVGLAARSAIAARGAAAAEQVAKAGTAAVGREAAGASTTGASTTGASTTGASTTGASTSTAGTAGASSTTASESAASARAAGGASKAKQSSSAGAAGESLTGQLSRMGITPEIAKDPILLQQKLLDAGFTRVTSGDLQKVFHKDGLYVKMADPGQASSRANSPQFAAMRDQEGRAAMDVFISGMRRMNEQSPGIVPQTERLGPTSLIQREAGGVGIKDVEGPFKIRAQRNAERVLNEMTARNPDLHFDPNLYNFRFDPRGNVLSWFDPL